MRWFLGITAVALAVTGSGSAELVARVPDGMIAVTPSGSPVVAFVRGQQLVVAQRAGRNRWTQRPARVARGPKLAAFKAGRAGPVAVLIGPADRSVSVLRRQGARWLTTRLSGGLGSDFSVGWPGAALAPRGRPARGPNRGA